MSVAGRSLRFRLAVVGWVSMVLPVLVLLAAFAFIGEDLDVSTDDPGVADAEPRVLPPVLLLVAATLVVAGGGFAWWWASRAVAPLRRMRLVAEEIQGVDLSRRIGLAHGPDEIRRLAQAFDAMLDRLERASSEQLRLIEEASHELRTPLAVLIANADAVLAERQPSIELYRDGLRRSGNAGRRLSSVVDELLIDARSRARTLQRHPVDLRALVVGVVDLALPMAATRRVTVDLSAPAEVLVPLDAPSVARAITNLLDNAVKHAPPRSSVRIEVASTATDASVTVIDQGPGIDPDDLPHVFERSYRAALDRSGSGLGLPIARQVAQAHGGSVTVEAADPTGGCQVRFTLRVGREPGRPTVFE